MAKNNNSLLVLSIDFAQDKLIPHFTQEIPGVLYF